MDVPVMFDIDKCFVLNTVNTPHPVAKRFEVIPIRCPNVTCIIEPAWRVVQLILPKSLE